MSPAPEVDFAERQAPISAMQQFGQLLGVLPTSGGSEGNSSSQSSSSPGLLGGFSSLF